MPPMPRPELADGLTLRWSTAEDAEQIADFASRIFRDGAEDPPSAVMRGLVLRQMRGDFPFMGPGDYAIVEDPRKTGNRIVACACHLREDWSFDGIHIPVGRPEIVASDPDYRNRGLVRAIFGALHERSEQEGRPLTAITGIRYFYRQFGYEYALDLGGRATVPTAMVPELPDGETEKYVLRSAKLSDVPMIVDCYRREHSSSLVSVQVPDAFWRYRIETEQPGQEHTGHRVRVLESLDGNACGFVLASYDRRNDTYQTTLIGTVSGTNLLELAPSILRGLRQLGEQVPAKKPDVPLRKLEFELGRDHPFYRVLQPAWAPQIESPYAWYVRVPDIPGFLRLVAPVLERRLADSALAGYDGEVKIDLYRGGLALQLSKGKLANVDPIRFAPHDNSAKAAFSELVFLQLLFGHRSAAELQSIYPDFWIGPEIRPLIDVLFPKRPSHVFDL